MLDESKLYVLVSVHGGMNSGGVHIKCLSSTSPFLFKIIFSLLFSCWPIAGVTFLVICFV